MTSAVRSTGVYCSRNQVQHILQSVDPAASKERQNRKLVCKKLIHKSDKHTLF